MPGLTFVPSPPLSDFISCIWFQEDYLPPHPKERALPDGSVEVIIVLRGDRLAGRGQALNSSYEQTCASLVYGPRTEVFLIDTSSPRSILGIHFKPGGAFPFFGIPADELHNHILPLDLFWGSQTDDLRERLAATRSVAERFHLMETFLRARVATPLIRHPAVDYALRIFQSPFNAFRVADVVDRVGLSSRRFSQLFREQVGMTPKAFHRLYRFQNALHRIVASEQVSWADLALACGYFDQAHFIHDFKAFSGLTPLEYQMQEGKRPGHVPITF
jgi:AraC-like DNA-binding protein